MRRTSAYLSIETNLAQILEQVADLQKQVSKSVTSNSLDKTLLKDLQRTAEYLERINNEAEAGIKQASTNLRSAANVIKSLSKEGPLATVGAHGNDLKSQIRSRVRSDAEAAGIKLSQAEVNRRTEARMASNLIVGREAGIDDKAYSKAKRAYTEAINKATQIVKDDAHAKRAGIASTHSSDTVAQAKETLRIAKELEKAAKSYRVMEGDLNRFYTASTKAVKGLSTLTAEINKSKKASEEWGNQFSDQTTKVERVVTKSTKKIVNEVRSLMVGLKQAQRDGIMIDPAMYAGSFDKVQLAHKKLTDDMIKNGHRMTDAQRKASREMLKEMERFMQAQGPALRSVDRTIEKHNKRIASLNARTAEKDALNTFKGKDYQSAKKAAWNTVDLLKGIKSGEIDINSMSPEQLREVRAALQKGQWAIGQFSARTLSHSAKYGTATSMAETLGVDDRSEMLGLHQATLSQIRDREREMAGKPKGFMGRVRSAFNRSNDSPLNRYNHGVTNLSQMAGMSLYGMGAAGLFTGLMRTTVGQQSEMQSMKNTLAGMLNTYATFVDLQGQSLDKATAFNRALLESDSMYGSIREKAVKSILTTQEMFEYVLSGGAPLMNRGLDFNQTLSIVDKVASIGKAMGYQPTAIQSDIRDLAMGKVDMRSQILRTIGFNSEDLKSATSKGPQGLMDYFTSRLAGFEPALQRLESTPQSKISRAQDQLQQIGIRIGGEAMGGFLDGLEDIEKTLNGLVADGTVEKFGRSLSDLSSGLITITTKLMGVLGPLLGNFGALTAVGVGVAGARTLAGAGWASLKDNRPGVANSLAGASAAIALAAALWAAQKAAMAFADATAERAAKFRKNWEERNLENSPKDAAATMKYVKDLVAQGVTKVPANYQTIADRKFYQLETLQRLIKDAREGRMGPAGTTTTDRALVNSLFNLAGSSGMTLKRSPKAILAQGNRIGFDDILPELVGEILGNITGKDYKVDLFSRIAKGGGGNYMFTEDIANEYQRMEQRLQDKSGKSGMIISNQIPALLDMALKNPTAFADLDKRVTASSFAQFGGKSPDDAAREKMVSEFNLQASLLRYASQNVGYRMGGLADTDPSRALYMAQQASYNRYATKVDFNSAMTKAAGDPIATQQAALEYRQAIEAIDNEFQQSLRTLRESIIAKKQENELAKQNLEIARQNYQTTKTEMELDRAKKIDPSNVGKSLSLVGQLIQQDNRNFRSRRRLNNTERDNQLNLIGLADDPFTQVASFFRDLKINGLPDIKIHSKDMDFLKGLMDATDKGFGELNKNLPTLNETVTDLIAQMKDLTKGVNASSGVLGAGQVYPAGFIGPVPPGATIKDGLKPHVRHASDLIKQKFGIKNIGGFRKSAIDQHGHPAGRALDIMIPDNLAGKAQGDALAIWLQSQAEELGLEYLIWQQKISSYKDGKWTPWKAMKNRGSRTANHYDHIHANFLAALGAGDSHTAHRSTDTLSAERVRMDAAAKALDLETERLRSTENRVNQINDIFSSSQAVKKARYEFKASQYVGMIGLEPGAASYQKGLNIMDLQMYDRTNAIESDLLSSRDATARQLASLYGQQGMLNTGTVGGKAKALSISARIQQVLQAQEEKELAGWEEISGLQRQRAEYVARLTKIQEDHTRMFGEEANNYSRMLAANMAVYGKTGRELTAAQLGVRSDALTNQANDTLSKANYEAQKLYEQAAQYDAAGNPLRAMIYRNRAKGVLAQGNAAAMPLMQGAVNLNAEKSNTEYLFKLMADSAERLAANLEKASQTDYAKSIEAIFDPKTSSLAGTLRDSLTKNLEMRLGGIDERVGAARIGMIAALRMQGVPEAQIESIVRQSEPMFRNMRTGMVQDAYRTSSNSAYAQRGSLKKAMLADLLNSGIANASAGFYGNPLGIFNGGLLDMSKQLYGPLIDRSQQGLAGNMSLLGALTTGGFNAETLASQGYNKIPFTNSYMTPDGKAMTLSQIKSSLLRNTAYSMAGSIGGNWAGQQIGGDPEAVSFGSTLGGALFPALFPGLGAMAAPLGLFGGGLLGGLFKKKKGDDRTEQWMNAVLNQLKQLNQNLRPRPEFEAVKGEALFGKASRYLGARTMALETIEAGLLVRG